MNAPAPAEGPTPLEQLGQWLRLGPAFFNQASHLVILLVVAVAAGYVVSPGLQSQQIPTLTADDLGRPFRAPSPSGFKANRDYEIVDEAATAQHRDAARAAVLPVFDFKPTVAQELKQSVREAYAMMREAARPPEPVDPRKKPPPPELTTERLKASQPAWAQRLFGTERGLEDEDFNALANARFSEEAERATILLLERAYQLPVVASREELTREGGKGITVRSLIDLSETVRQADPESVRDVREAQSELERFASVPGNILPDTPTALRRAVLRLGKRLVRPNLTVNSAETEARRVKAADGVKKAVVQIKKGEKVIGDGELLNEGHLVRLAGMRAQADELDVVSLQFGGTGLIALLIGSAYAFFRAASRKFRPTRKDAVLVGTLLVLMLGLIQLSVTVSDAVHDKYARIPAEALYFGIPMAVGAMLVRFILVEEMAVFFALVLASVAGMMLGHSLSFGVFALIGSLVAANRITRAKDRVGIFRAGVETGIVNVFAVLFLSLVEGKGLGSDTLLAAGFAFVGTTIGAPVLLMGLTPLIEASFGYASDIKLLELANLNHPALKELIVQAPGTYHHSIIIGSLVENAAEAIGANPLLARSCAYYHDIGKGKNPLYFGENQKGENRHDTLAPAMSAVIIKRHVTDGIEMARQYRLPKLVADAIPQHHGTRVVGYFFHKALKEQEGKEHPQPVDDSIYRYPGPKPQFREAALVMIADAVESSCRAMKEPTTEKLQAQVQKIINVIFSEGQLDECDLTLRDLNLIAKSFLHTLEGIYHTRPVYPPGAVGGRPSGEHLKVAGK